MKKILFSLIALLSFSACSSSSYEANWQTFGLSLSSPMPVYLFDVNVFFKEADPYKSALYFNENAEEFLNVNSKDWTSLRILNEACAERKAESQTESHTFWYFPYDETRCFEWKILPEDLSAMQSAKASMTWEALTPTLNPATR